MNINNNNLILLIVIIFVLLLSNSITVSASEIKASNYEINIEIDNQMRVTSERVNLERILKEETGNSIYVEPSIISNNQGEKIPDSLIEIKTSKGNYNLSTYNFLLMTENQASGWIEIELNPAVVNLRPGDYQGHLKITGLDWHQIDINITVKPFLQFNVTGKDIEIDIDQPRDSGIYVAKDEISLTILSNHNDWEIIAHLKDHKLETDDNDTLAIINQNNILYRIDSGNFINREEDLNDYKAFPEDGSVLMVRNRDLFSNNVDIKFALQLPSSWSDQLAGKYHGEVIFTIKSL